MNRCGSYLRIQLELILGVECSLIVTLMKMLLIVYKSKLSILVPAVVRVQRLLEIQCFMYLLLCFMLSCL